MKICWIIPQNSTSPLEMIFARKGLEGLRQNGHEVFIFPFTKRHNPLGILQELLSLKKIIQEKNIDLIHAHFGSTTGLLALLSHKDFVVTFRGSDVNGDPGSNSLANFFRLFLARLVAMKAKHVISVSQEISLKIGMPSKTTVLPSPTDLKIFRPIPKVEAKEKLNLRPEIKYIAFASSGGRKLKRADLADAVIAKLKNLDHQVELLKIEKMPQDEVPFFLNASEALILTSDFEGSPNIVREALSCGIPVCSFDVGDVRDWIHYDKFSSVIEGRSTSEMALTIDKILKVQVPRERRVLSNLFSEESYVLKLNQIYLKSK